ncbi:hypothetical protein RAB80_009281 [Fusarium oxysporum f. sp. vasinfectum]|nr:hypothetical protein RAB80_009281 [Fusarium oxysporum f. sp. vasinfectum]
MASTRYSPLEEELFRLYREYRETKSIDAKALFFSPECRQICRTDPDYAAKDRDTILRYLRESGEVLQRIYHEAGWDISEMDPASVRSFYTMRPLLPNETEDFATIRELAPAGFASSEEVRDKAEVETDSDAGPKWYWTNPPASVWARKEEDTSIIRDLIQFKGLPRCRALTLHTNGEQDFEVDADWDNNDIANNYIYFCCEPEDWGEVKRKEERYSWRAALRDMYSDIATLSSLSPAKNLVLAGEKEWPEFLGRLKKLTLNTYGGNNGAGWRVNTLPGFHAFFNELPMTVLAHANALEYFKLKTHDDGFLGGKGSLYIPPGCMPSLRSLHVDGIAVTSVLTDYLKATNGTLSKICVTECVAFTSDPNGDDAPKWADLWRAARQALRAPAEVVCVPTKERPITEDEGDYYGDEVYVPPADEDDKIKSWRRKSNEEEGLCIWPYGWLDEKYGSIYPDHEVNLERLENGEDNLEFKLLMDEVKRGGGKCTVS